MDFIDTSILVAAIITTERGHETCGHLLDSGRFGMYQHGVAETFSTLTGGRQSLRLSPSLAVDVIEGDYLPDITITALTPAEMLRALRDAENRGVRGGAVYDYLHLVAARKAKAARFYTLNLAHFLALRREGDPDIVVP